MKLAEHNPSNPRILVDQRLAGYDQAKIERIVFEEARDMARHSGRVQPEDGVLRSVEQMADRTVAGIFGEGYDPKVHAEDALHEAEYKELIGDRSGARQQLGYARASYRELAFRAASLFLPRVPDTPWLLLILVVLAIAITLAPTFHDLLFAAMLANPAQAAYASIVAGVMIGGCFSWAMLSRVDHPEGERFLSRLQLTVIGILFGIALLVMRLGVATSDEERLIAIGFALLETSIVLLIEAFAAGLARKWIRYMDSLPEVSIAENRRQASREHLDVTEAELLSAQTGIKSHIQLVHEREARALVARQLNASARAMAVAGYFKGLEQNRGFVHDAALVQAALPKTRGRKSVDAHDGDNGHSPDDGAPWLG